MKIYIAVEWTSGGRIADLQEWEVVKETEDAYIATRLGVERTIQKKDIGIQERVCMPQDEAYEVSKEEAVAAYRTQLLHSARYYEQLSRKCREQSRVGFHNFNGYKATSNENLADDEIPF